MKMMGEHFEAPKVASALRTHNSNLRSATESHKTLPTSARHFKMYLHRLKPESLWVLFLFLFSCPSSSQVSGALGVHAGPRAPEHSPSRMEPPESKPLRSGGQGRLG